VVDFGSSRDNDRPYGVIKGKLSLTRQEAETPFEDVIKRIAGNCLELLNGRKVQVCLIFSSCHAAIFILHPSISFWWEVLGSHLTSKRDLPSFSIDREPLLSLLTNPRACNRSLLCELLNVDLLKAKKLLRE
jgi:hypothetical protein